METQAEFDRFLTWLDPDRDKAGAKYVLLRRKLIVFFTGRGCPLAEDLADETINRVVDKIPEIGPGYAGDQSRYFFGVARYVYLESLLKPHFEHLMNQVSATSEREAERQDDLFDCLDVCLASILPKDRELILNYYAFDRKNKHPHRLEMAKQLQLTPNSLSKRAERIRVKLKGCLTQCLSRKGYD